MLKATDGNTTVYYTRGFELISRREGTIASYYVYDGGLSVRALTNEAGIVTDTLVTDSFGNETGRTGATDSTYGFQCEEQDATGLYYLRARYMDPATGTFTTMDTYGGNLSDPMSLHKYLFANSNPVMYCDPSGHFSLVEFELSEAIDEILMSSLSFGMAYIGVVNDNPNMSDTEKLAGYFVALGLGALFPFGVALLQAILPVLVAALALASISLILTLISTFVVDHEKNPTAGALLDITAGAAWGAALSNLGLAFAQNARKTSGLIYLEADSSATIDGCNWDNVDQEIDDWFWANQNNSIEKYNNLPPNQGFNSFDELKRAVGSAGKGYDWHHIVEQSQIKKSGFAPEIIHNTNNIIAVDHETHLKISGYYNTKSFDFTNGLSVRDWLAGQSYEEPYEFGLNVLKMFEVI